MRSALKIAEELLEDGTVEYFLTYKSSQDHLETFFSVIRRMWEEWASIITLLAGNSNQPIERLQHMSTPLYRS